MDHAESYEAVWKGRPSPSGDPFLLEELAGFVTSTIFALREAAEHCWMLRQLIIKESDRTAAQKAELFVTAGEPPQADKPERGVAVAENGGNILAARYESAYQSYEHASRKLPPEKQTDQEAYEFLKEYGMPEYKLPAYETWKRYVREGRHYHGTQKKHPTVGRAGRSIASPSDVQTRNLDAESGD